MLMICDIDDLSDLFERLKIEEAKQRAKSVRFILPSEGR